MERSDIINFHFHLLVIGNFDFWNRVSLGSPDYLGALYVEEVNFRFTEICLLLSQRCCNQMCAPPHMVDTCILKIGSHQFLSIELVSLYSRNFYLKSWQRSSVCLALVPSADFVNPVLRKNLAKQELTHLLWLLSTSDTYILLSTMQYQIAFITLVLLQWESSQAVCRTITLVFRIINLGCQLNWIGKYLGDQLHTSYEYANVSRSNWLMREGHIRCE